MNIFDMFSLSFIDVAGAFELGMRDLIIFFIIVHICNV